MNTVSKHSIDDVQKGLSSGRSSDSPLILVLGKDDGNGEMTESHGQGTGGEDRLAADLVNIQHGRDGGDEHDNTDDTSSEK